VNPASPEWKEQVMALTDRWGVDVAVAGPNAPTRTPGHEQDPTFQPAQVGPLATRLTGMEER
jgi:hypothetical protein